MHAGSTSQVIVPKMWAALASGSQITGSFKVVFCVSVVIDGPIFSF